MKHLCSFVSVPLYLSIATYLLQKRGAPRLSQHYLFLLIPGISFKIENVSESGSLGSSRLQRSHQNSKSFQSSSGSGRNEILLFSEIEFCILETWDARLFFHFMVIKIQIALLKSCTIGTSGLSALDTLAHSSWTQCRMTLSSCDL